LLKKVLLKKEITEKDSHKKGTDYIKKFLKSYLRLYGKRPTCRSKKKSRVRRERGVEIERVELFPTGRKIK